MREQVSVFLPCARFNLGKKKTGTFGVSPFRQHLQLGDRKRPHVRGE